MKVEDNILHHFLILILDMKEKDLFVGQILKERFKSFILLM